MKIIESAMDSEKGVLIDDVILEAVERLDIDITKHSTTDIMKMVDDTIVALVFEKETPLSQDENPALLLGALWGAQLVRQFQWYWAEVLVNDEHKELAIISPQQEMIIFPISFAAACIHKQCICTLMLAFNMLLKNPQLGQIPPGSYENIMLGIHHIIPPYTLEPTH